jgi:hypothetical protein
MTKSPTARHQGDSSTSLSRDNVYTWLFTARSEIETRKLSMWVNFLLILNLGTSETLKNIHRQGPKRVAHEVMRLERSNRWLSPIDC